MGHDFTEVMQRIQVYKEKKNSLSSKLALLTDKSEYQRMDTHKGPKDKSHMNRLLVPWPEAQIPQMKKSDEELAAAKSAAAAKVVPKPPTTPPPRLPRSASYEQWLGEQSKAVNIHH